MFNDYNGKQFVPDHPKQSEFITSFYCSQKNLSKLFIDSLRSLNRKTNYKITVKNNDNIEIYSKGFNELFKKYYKMHLEKDYSYVDENDDEIEYKIYIGYLKKSMFKTKNQKLSFIAGVFLRYGTFLDKNKVRLTFANSPTQFKTSRDFLRKLGFKNLDIFTCKEIRTPCGQTITFELNKEYKSLFLKLQTIKTADLDESDCK